MRIGLQTQTTKRMIDTEQNTQVYLLPLLCLILMFNGQAQLPQPVAYLGTKGWNLSGMRAGIIPSTGKLPGGKIANGRDIPEWVVRRSEWVPVAAWVD